MIVFKCDICGKSLTQNSGITVKIDIDYADVAAHEWHHVCNDCKNEVLDLVREINTRPKDKL